VRTPKDDTVHKRGSHVPGQSARKAGPSPRGRTGGAKEARHVETLDASPRRSWGLAVTHRVPVSVYRAYVGGTNGP